MTEFTSRRQFIGLVAGTATVAFAGCSGGESADGAGTGTPEGTETGGSSGGTATAGSATATATESPTDTATEGASGETDTEASPTETEAEGTETDGSSEGTATDGEPYMNGVGDDASVSFEVPSDGTSASSRYVPWQASAEGVTIEEAGQVNEGAGHYHVLVDTEPVEPGEVIPSDDQHLHFGTGQSDGVLELEPGDHTLHLQVGDGEHRAMDLTDTVEVTVEDEAAIDLSTSVDGSVVEWEVTTENYEIEPASEGITVDAGHLHAIIDADHVPVGEVIPTDARHVHFGDGSTSGSLDLAEQLGDEYEAGEHQIHFQVGTGTHRATMVHAHTTVTTE